MTTGRLNDDEIAERLSRLPGWTLEDGAIVRGYRTTSWKSTLMLVNAIGFVAEAAWHHPDLSVGYAKVTVRLSTHDAGGLTDRDFDLAARIDAVVGWQPAADSALEGAPADARILK
jgi:4a-hydroxytetrahydrobiopterin dehydratase